jgi:hypothetical protein
VGAHTHFSRTVLAVIVAIVAVIVIASFAGGWSP